MANNRRRLENQGQHFDTGLRSLLHVDFKVSQPGGHKPSTEIGGEEQCFFKLQKNQGII